MTRESSEIGKLGEGLACNFLLSKGYSIIRRNFACPPFGEIDIICEKAGRLIFVEVKSVSGSIALPTTSDRYRAEDNIHKYKIERLKKAVKVYLATNKLSEEADWEFCVVTIVIDSRSKKVKAKLFQNAVL